MTTYRQAQLHARARAASLRLESLQRVDAALADYARALANAIAELPGGDTQRQLAAARALEIFRRMRARLQQRLLAAVRDGRTTSFAEILRIYNDATLTLAAAKDIPRALLGAVVTPNVTIASAWESLGTGAASWRTLLKGYVDDAVADAQAVVTRGLLEGVGPDELSRRLRPYVQGSEPFQKAFKGLGEISDKMLRDPNQTGAARRLRYNADRIAFSEVHNARAEAEVQAFAADPFVEAVRWELSPDRGTQDKPDACDVLANTDFYGLGRGVYPVFAVPTSPHPFDRCERVPVPRDWRQMNEPKPNPPRKQGVKLDFGGREGELTPTELERAKAMVFEALISPNIAEKAFQLQLQNQLGF